MPPRGQTRAPSWPMAGPGPLLHNGPRRVVPPIRVGRRLGTPAAGAQQVALAGTGKSSRIAEKIIGFTWDNFMIEI